MSKSLRILFLENSPHDAEQAVALLEDAGYSCYWQRVERREEFLKQLENGEYDLVLADCSRPTFDGLSVVELFVERGLDIPIILISGSLGEAKAVECLKAGATDVVLKQQMFRLPQVVERALHEAKERRRVRRADDQIGLQAAALESAANAIVLTDAQGKITFVNSAFTTLTGFSRDEAMDQDLRILKSGEHSAAFYAEMWNTILSGKVWKGEVVNKRKDGSRYLEEQTITPLIKDTGVIVNFIAIKEDISERKKAEEEQLRLNAQLDRERGLLNNIVASVPGVVWELWGEPNAAQVDFVSDYIETMLGYSGEWVSTPSFWLSIVHPEDREATGEAVAKAYANGESGVQEFRWIKKDGGYLWVEGRFVTILDETGTPIGMRGVTLDISPRKLAEEKIRESQEQMAEAQRLARVGSWNWAFPGSDLAWSDEHYRIFGLQPGEIDPGYEDVVEKYVHKDDQELVRGRVANSLVTLEPFEFHYRVVHPNGEVHTLHSIGNVVGDESGHPLRMYGTTQDVTEMVLAEEQLRQSQKMEAVGLLAGGIAHDFNNLLTAINGYSELTLRKLKEGDPLRANLEVIQDAGERAAALTHQLLAFSRKQVLNPRVHNLNSVITNIEKMLRRIIRESIEIQIVLDPELGNIKADPGQIEQVIMNLAVNARDAMPHGGRLTIETKNVLLDDDYASHHIEIAPGPFVQMTVTDTGEGMDEQTRQRIFEPFFTTKEAGKGTGLGLSTVHGIVKQSGGHILVQSEVGRGTSFTIYLPSVDEILEKPNGKGDGVENYSGTETILLVEDDEIVRDFVHLVLTSNGYKVLEADRGTAAVSLSEAHSGPIHLLLADLIMPGMSCGALKDRVVERRPDIKVVLMSGYTDDTQLHSGVLESCAAFLEKPFTADDVLRKIREVLES